MEMYKTQNRFEEAANLLAKMPWLSNASGHEGAVGSTTPIEEAIGTPVENSSLSDSSDAEASVTANETVNVRDMEAVIGEETNNTEVVDTSAIIGASLVEDNDSEARLFNSTGEGIEDEGQILSDVDDTLSSEGSSPTVDDELDGIDSSSSGRQESSAARGGTGGARMAGLGKVASTGSSVATESSEEAEAARALVERHVEAMRTRLNEVVGELAVTTVTRLNTPQDWLDSHVVAAEEVRTGSVFTTSHAFC